MQLTVDKFLDWADNFNIEYASTTVNGKRLKFFVTLKCPHQYIVSWGDDILFTGQDIREAFDVFNNIVEQK